MAIAITKTNLLIGGATTLELGGNDLGPVDEGGIVYTADQSFFDFKVDQKKATIKKEMTNRAVTIEMTLAEPTLANLLAALNEGTALDGCSLLIDDVQADEATLQFVGVAPNTGTRTYHFYAVVVTSNGAHTISKSGQVLLPVTFEALYDTTENKFGYVLDA